MVGPREGGTVPLCLLPSPEEEWLWGDRGPSAAQGPFTRGAGRAFVGGASLRCDRIASAGFSLVPLYLPHFPPTVSLVGRSIFSSHLHLSCLPEGREGGGQGGGLGVRTLVLFGSEPFPSPLDSEEWQRCESRCRGNKSKWGKMVECSRLQRWR